MCELVIGPAFEQTGPKVGFKVLRRTAGELKSLYHDVPYSLHYRLHSEASNCWTGRVYHATPTQTHDSSPWTSSGIHLFTDHERAYRYVEGSYEMVKPVIYWGTCLPFEGGVAAEFVTLL